jgi:hypothetical protein
MEIYINGEHYKAVVNRQERQELKKTLTDESFVNLYHRPISRVPSSKEKPSECRFLSKEEIWRHKMTLRNNTWLGQQLKGLTSKRQQIVQVLLKGDKVSTGEIVTLIKSLMKPEDRPGKMIDKADVANALGQLMKTPLGKHIIKTKLGHAVFYQIYDPEILDKPLKEVLKISKKTNKVTHEKATPIELDKEVKESRQIQEQVQTTVPSGLEALIGQALAQGIEVVIKFRPQD